MRRKRATEFVTSDEMTLRDFYGAILLFWNENQYLSSPETMAEGRVHTKIQTGFSQKLLGHSELNFV